VYHHITIGIAVVNGIPEVFLDIFTIEVLADTSFSLVITLIGITDVCISYMQKFDWFFNSDFKT
jgi:hypothetical protein